MSDFITLTCPSCGARVNASSHVGRFTCEYCGNEHLLKVTAQAVPVETEPEKIMPQIPIPDGVQVEKDHQSACIIQRWFSWKYIPMAFFCVMWDGFLCFWYSMAFSQGSGAPLMMLIFPLFHVAVGVGLSYSTLAGFVNKTVLELNKDHLSVWFEPLPWLGEKKLKTSDIKQLYCRETVHHGKRSTTVTYELHAVTNDFKQVKLLTGLSSSDIALYFEQTLEKWLRIKDQRVLGELYKG